MKIQNNMIFSKNHQTTQLLTTIIPLGSMKLLVKNETI